MSSAPTKAARRVVCVQGLGFVGAANAIAIASAKGADGKPLYDVVGVELPTPMGKERAESINRGEFPYATTDKKLRKAARDAGDAGNLRAVVDPKAFGEADIIVVDVGLDLEGKGDNPTFAVGPFQGAIRAVGDHMRPDALVLLESTVPPGTSEFIAAPLLRERLEARRLPNDDLKLAFCYERVMPGNAYYDSIVNIWRVYAGLTPKAADEAEAFLSSFINVEQWPLRRLSNIRSVELAKVMENTYRAINIALIDEWERFARKIGIDMFEVTDAIRMRPTHNNIRFPGLGVGGYCLTKDPLFGPAAAREIFKLEGFDFPLSRAAVRINDDMPLVTVELLSERLQGLKGRRLLVLGASYRQDVGDTRTSPSFILAEALLKAGAEVVMADPLVEPADMTLEGVEFAGKQVPAPDQFDAVILAVAHQEYRTMDFAAWLGSTRPLLLDSNGVLGAGTLNELAKVGVPVAAIGRGF